MQHFHHCHLVLNCLWHFCFGRPETSNQWHSWDRGWHEAQLMQTARLQTHNPEHLLLQSAVSPWPNHQIHVGFTLLQPLGTSAMHPVLKTTKLCHQTQLGFRRQWKGKTCRLCESAAQLLMQGQILMLLGTFMGLPHEVRHYPAGVTASKSSSPSIWLQPASCSALRPALRSQQQRQNWMLSSWGWKHEARLLLRLWDGC